MSAHQWVPYTGILTTEPYASQVREAGLGPHTRTCSVCGVLTDDDDDVEYLQCSPDGVPRLSAEGLTAGRPGVGTFVRRTT